MILGINVFLFLKFKFVKFDINKMLSKVLVSKNEFGYLFFS